MSEQHSRQDAYFAAGCFWGVQDAFDKTEGVLETTAGYMGGHVKDPTYKQVCAGGTDHVETVHVIFDPNVVTYEQLLNVFWRQVQGITFEMLNYPTGQYMPVVFYQGDSQKANATILSWIWESMQGGRGKRAFAAVMLVSLEKASDFTFWPEPDEHHQHHGQKCGTTCSR